eukprot:356499-Chlamydomonas_euryale.AAC.7
MLSLESGAGPEALKSATGSSSGIRYRPQPWKSWQDKALESVEDPCPGTCGRPNPFCGTRTEGLV